MLKSNLSSQYTRVGWLILPKLVSSDNFYLKCMASFVPLYNLYGDLLQVWFSRTAGAHKYRADTDSRGPLYKKSIWALCSQIAQYRISGVSYNPPAIVSHKIHQLHPLHTLQSKETMGPITCRALGQLHMCYIHPWNMFSSCLVLSSRELAEHNVIFSSCY